MHHVVDPNPEMQAVGAVGEPVKREDHVLPCQQDGGAWANRGKWTKLRLAFSRQAVRCDWRRAACHPKFPNVTAIDIDNASPLTRAKENIRGKRSNPFPIYHLLRTYLKINRSDSVNFQQLKAIDRFGTCAHARLRRDTHDCPPCRSSSRPVPATL